MKPKNKFFDHQFISKLISQFRNRWVVRLTGKVRLVENERLTVV